MKRQVLNFKQWMMNENKRQSGSVSKLKMNENTQDGSDELVSISQISEIIDLDFDATIHNEDENSIEFLIDVDHSPGTCNISITKNTDGTFTGSGESDYNETQWDEETDEEKDMEASGEFVTDYKMNTVGDLISFLNTVAGLQYHFMTDGESVNGVTVNNINIDIF